MCVACGLWGGLGIGLQTEYFTSNRYRPVQVRLQSEMGIMMLKLTRRVWLRGTVFMGGCTVFGLDALAHVKAATVLQQGLTRLTTNPPCLC